MEKLNNEDRNNLYCSPNIVRVIKSRRTRWAGHVARMGRGETYTGVWWGYLKERDHWEDPAVDGRIMLRWIFRQWDVGGMDWIELAQDRDSSRALVNLRVP